MTENPDVLKKVQNEVDDFFATHTEENLGESEEKFAYLMQAVNETMRITPAVVDSSYRQGPAPHSLFGFDFPANVPPLPLSPFTTRSRFILGREGIDLSYTMIRAEEN